MEQAVPVIDWDKFVEQYPLKGTLVKVALSEKYLISAGSYNERACIHIEDAGKDEILDSLSIFDRKTKKKINEINIPQCNYYYNSIKEIRLHKNSVLIKACNPIFIADIHNPESIQEISLYKNTRSDSVDQRSYYCSAIALSEKYFATGFSKGFTVRNMNGLRMMHIERDKQVSALSLKEDRVAVGFEDGTTRIYDIPMKRELIDCKDIGWVRLVDFFEEYVLIVAKKNWEFFIIRLYDAVTGEKKAEHEHKGNLYDAAHANGRLFTHATLDKTDVTSIDIFNILTGEKEFHVSTQDTANFPVIAAHDDSFVIPKANPCWRHEVYNLKDGGLQAK